MSTKSTKESPDVEAAPIERPDNAVVGRVDNTTARSGADALTGHFVNIDTSDAAVKKEYEDKNLASHQSYGVFLEAGDTNKDGWPETVVVRLRDDTNALVTVPYAALSRAEAGGR